MQVYPLKLIAPSTNDASNLLNVDNEIVIIVPYLQRLGMLNYQLFYSHLEVASSCIGTCINKQGLHSNFEASFYLSLK